MTDATLGASGLWLGTRTGVGGTATLTESFSWPQPMAPWTTGVPLQWLWARTALFNFVSSFSFPLDSNDEVILESCKPRTRQQWSHATGISFCKDCDDSASKCHQIFQSVWLYRAHTRWMGSEKWKYFATKEKLCTWQVSSLHRGYHVCY